MNEVADPLKERLAGHWNQRSVTFDREQGIRTPRQKEAWLGFLRRQLGQRPCQVLDVGTGTGFLALLVAELGHRCRGIDLSPEMLSTARRNAEQQGLDVQLERGDAEKLAEADDTYDVVINRNVLWTLPEPERAVREWIRVLRPAGRLVLIDGDWFDERFSYRFQQFLGKLLLAVTTGRNPWAGIRRMRSDYNTRFDDHLPLMRPGNHRQRISDLVTACGFADVRIEAMAAVDAADKADRRLALRLLRPHQFFVITASKPAVSA